MLSIIKTKIEKILTNCLKQEVFLQEQLEHFRFDFALPLFFYAKQKQTSPNVIFEIIQQKIFLVEDIQEVLLINGFLNIQLKRASLAKNILLQINKLQHHYGTFPKRNQTVVIDYSSPNIAKNFSIGHLRSTVIGNALKKIYQKLGFNVIGVNHLGDWGKQFGQMIVAYQRWGCREKVLQDPVNELQKLYFLFHQKAKLDITLNEEANVAFRELEQKNHQYFSLWQWFREVSLKEFKKIYDLLDISFDSFLGESFYNDKIDLLIEELKHKKLLKQENQMWLVELNNLPPGLIKKTNGSTLYLTRDLAAFKYRYLTYNCQSILYVVGNEQKLYFQQLSQVIDKMGYKDVTVENINFGLVLVDGKKLSTRYHKFTTLLDIIDQATLLVQKIIQEKTPTLPNLNLIARKIAVGAIIFNDLKNDRHLDIDFNLENVLQFKGQTGPYLQYTATRLYSLLQKEIWNDNLIDSERYKQGHYFVLIKLLDQFPAILKKTYQTKMPSVLSRYILKMTQHVNFFYSHEKVLTIEPIVTNTNLLLMEAVLVVLKESLRLLGIPFLEKM